MIVPSGAEFLTCPYKDREKCVCVCVCVCVCAETDRGEKRGKKMERMMKVWTKGKHQVKPK